MKPLVVFDLGRVLIRICDGWQHAFERVGVTLAADVLDDPTRRRLLDGVSRIETGDLPVSAFCDEVAAHLDPKRRAALFSRLRGRGQVWMTATEEALFEGVAEASRFHVEGGAVTAT